MVPHLLQSAAATNPSPAAAAAALKLPASGPPLFSCCPLAPASAAGLHPLPAAPLLLRRSVSCRAGGGWDTAADPQWHPQEEGGRDVGEGKGSHHHPGRPRRRGQPFQGEPFEGEPFLGGDKPDQYGRLDPEAPEQRFAAWLAALEGEGYVVRRRAGGGVSVYARHGEPLHLVCRPPGAAAAASGGDGQEQGDIDAFQAIAWSTAWAASTYFVWQLYGWDAVIAAHGVGALLWALVHLRRRR